MNNDRRKTLARAAELVSEAKAILEDAKDAEQEAYDNMPESMQNGEKGEKAQAAVDALEEAVNGCDEIQAQIDTATE